MAQLRTPTFLPLTLAAACASSPGDPAAMATDAAGAEDSSSEGSGGTGSTTSSSSSSGGGESSSSESSSSSTSTSTSTSGTSSESSSSSEATGSLDDEGDTTDPGPGDEPPPARGVEIVDVTMDQGIRVPIAIGRQLVDGGARNQAILAGRPGVLRAFYEFDAGFVERDIYAVMTLHHDDGTTEEFADYRTVHDQACGGQAPHDCGYGSFIKSFNFSIPAESMTEGSSYEISLLETSPGHENDPSTKNARFPDADTLPIGVEERYMKMRVVLVPFRHDVGESCAEAPDIVTPVSASDPRTATEIFADRLAAHNPVDEVEVIPHAPVNFDGDAADSGPLLSTLRQLRSQEDAPPEQYYYGVIQPCQGGPDFSGVAQLGGPYKDEALNRVGWGVWYTSVTGTAGTFVHEIGHEQGRQHIACNGEEGGPDTDYPDHPEGDTISWGTDVFGALKIHPPTDHDYMTYCGSTWVSEWGWSLVFPAIEIISGWELEDDDTRPQTLLFGDVATDGSVSWWIGDSHFAPPAAATGHSIRFEVDGAVVDAPARVIRFERSSAYTVVAALPLGVSATSRATWIGAGRRQAIDLPRTVRIQAR